MIRPCSNKIWKPTTLQEECMQQLHPYINCIWFYAEANRTFCIWFWKNKPHIPRTPITTSDLNGVCWCFSRPRTTHTVPEKTMKKQFYIKTIWTGHKSLAEDSFSYWLKYKNIWQPAENPFSVLLPWLDIHSPPSRKRSPHSKMKK